MPSRCIFFFSAFSAWSILLSRTMICKRCSCRFCEGRLNNRRLRGCPLALANDGERTYIELDVAREREHRRLAAWPLGSAPGQQYPNSPSRGLTEGGRGVWQG